MWPLKKKQSPILKYKTVIGVEILLTEPSGYLGLRGFKSQEDAKDFLAHLKIQLETKRFFLYKDVLIDLKRFTEARIQEHKEAVEASL